MRFSIPLAAAVVGIAIVEPSAALSQRQLDSIALAQLRFRYIGPPGNRVSSVAGVPGDVDTYYAGAASGGLWKSTDGGTHWSAIFDGQAVSSIGALAVAPSDHDVVWVGTGEPFIRSHISIGWGVFKSTDAGKTWTKMGLENTGRISRIVVHPSNPDIVYVAALGHSYGPQSDRGIYRSTDGGKTWDRVLFVNDSTGASELVMDPTNPRILFAGMWQLEIHTWGRLSGGAGSGIWTSRDGGTTWKRLTGNGLPTKPVGKIGLAIPKANPNRIYALIETGDGVPAVNLPNPDRGHLFRSDDGGEHWRMMSTDRETVGRTHYFSRMGVTPDNPDEVYFLTGNWMKTLDGGETLIEPPSAEQPYGDHHDVWIDPLNGNRMVVGHDDGVAITTNRGRSWHRLQLPIAQMYHVAVDDRIPYYVYGNRQDGPSTRGPSHARFGGDIPRTEWRSVGGGESGWATPDPVDQDIVWSSSSGFGSLGGLVTRHDLRTGITHIVEVWPERTIGHSAAQVKYRFLWTFPLTISPCDHNKVYVGSQYVHETTDGGRSWQVISPDLTRNDTTRMRPSGGLTPDNLGVEYSGVVSAIAESRLTPGEIWAGTNDGKLQLTRDGGAHWTDVTKNLRGKPDWGTISNIEPSRFSKGVVYVTIDGHQVNNRDPWIYKTADFGAHWSLISSTIPRSPLSYAHVVREDPTRRGLLYAGLEGGIYISFDDGEHWQSFQNNLPPAPVYWIVVQERFNDLVVATYGRGFWILDDVTPLRVLPEVEQKKVSLFAPRPAYRFRNVEKPLDYWRDEDQNVGHSPPYGASLHYWLKDTTNDNVKIEILDAQGGVVRTLKTSRSPGVNRAYWDLRAEQTKEARIRVPPLFAPDFPMSPEGKPAPGVGRFSMLMPPGIYTVRLTVGSDVQTQPLEVLKDPNSAGSLDEIRAQTELTRMLANDLNATVDMINSIEILRAQLVTLKASLTGDSKAVDVVAQADSLDEKLVIVEEDLHQMRTTGRGQDQLRWPAKLAEQLNYLADQVTGSDMAPTTSQREVQPLLASRVQASKAKLVELMNGDVATFRAMLRARNVATIVP